MDDALLPAQVRAGRVLFELGYELTSDRMRRFAARVLEVIEDEPGTPVARIVEQGLEGIEDGPAALVAADPDLVQLQLPRPASTTFEAATLALEALVEQMMAARQR